MPPRGWTFITGATGFIGHYVVAELLRAGVRCVALVRENGADRLKRLLAEAASDLDPSNNFLQFLNGELPDRLPDCSDTPIERVIHVAGSTRFVESNGEPHRTNVEGTRELLDWMTANGISDLTHVSTAYVCGAGCEHAGEELASPAQFHNEYERSKCDAERLVVNWATNGKRRFVIARPSIVGGEYSSGRATEFRGFFALARAVEQLARSMEGETPERRRHIQLRLRGRGEDPNQLVPVDFVARAICALAMDHSAHGVYHLTNPTPLTNDDLKRWLEQYFDVGGGVFIGSRNVPLAEQSAAEKAFYWGTMPLASYFADMPAFDCARATDILGRHAISCPEADDTYAARCIRYAQSRRWGRESTCSEDIGQFGAAFFERFLPVHLPQSLVSRMTAVQATMRFIIDGFEWACRFEGGLLKEVQRGPNGLAEQFGYRTTASGFWQAIGGEIEGEQLFSSGQADVFGDIEAALKMSAILREFTREFPCDRARLAPLLGRA